MLSPEFPCATKAPAAKSKESPGKKGVTTKPVSAKMIKKRIR